MNTESNPVIWDKDKSSNLPEKVATISQTTLSMRFPNEKCCIFIRISPKFVYKGQIDNMSALV